MYSLKNRVALITGAASGIGRSTAVHFASLGCSLSLTDLDLTKLEETKQFCCIQDHENVDIFLQACDLTKQEDQERVVHDTMRNFGQLDILINCAGIMILNHTIMNTTMHDIDRTFDINFKSVLRMIQLCVPHLKVTKGRVVNVSSRLSQYPKPNCLPYCVSKSSIDTLTKIAAMELSQFGIRVNSVNPSVVNTNLLQDCNNVDLIMEESAKKTLLGRIAQPQDIAKSIAFLACDEADFITGINLVVDGGLSLRH